jgi:hypothetical protein
MAGQNQLAALARLPTFISSSRDAAIACSIDYASRHLLLAAHIILRYISRAQRVQFSPQLAAERTRRARTAPPIIIAEYVLPVFRPAPRASTTPTHDFARDSFAASITIARASSNHDEVE